MSLELSDPAEVLRAVRSLARTKRAEDQDFTSPSGAETRHIEVPKPGVVHPAHFAWIAECLEQSTEWVERTLDEGTPDESCGVRAIAKALSESRGPGRDRLSRIGVDPGELVLRRVPLAPGDARPNPLLSLRSNPVLSSENAALQMFRQGAQALTRLIELGAPAIIIDNRANQLQHQFRTLHHMLQGPGPLFEPYEELATDPPTPTSLIIPPPRGSWTGAPLRPLQVAVAGSSVVVRFPCAIARVNLQSGAFSTHPLGDAGLVAIVDGRALFTDGAHLVVFDMNEGEFTLEAPSLPRHVVVGACCGIAVLDTDTRMVATMPGPQASSPFGVVISGCGQYGWLELSPQLDDVGIFSVERLERVFQPWPHPSVGRPGDTEDLGEGHDDVARAVARLPDGSFRCVYGEHLLQDRTAHRLLSAPLAAAFDAMGDQLVTVDAAELRCYRLGVDANPSLKMRWSLKPLETHLSACYLRLEGSGLDEGSLMGAVGTVGALASLTPSELEERLFAESDASQRALATVIGTARSISLPSVLERLDL